jgi:hypothetical protein
MGARRASLAPVGLSLALLAPAAGCDWRDFDHLQARTPVLAVGATASFQSNDFGRVILPLSSRTGNDPGARFLVSATATTDLAAVDLDDKGQAKTEMVTSPTLASAQPVTALAEVPGAGQVLLGAPTGAEGTVYLLKLGAQPDVSVFDVAQPLDDRFGLGVAAGALAGGAAPDFVVASGNALAVYPDGDANNRVPGDPGTCPFVVAPDLAPRDQLQRAVLVAPLMGAPAQSQIVVGTPTQSDVGSVSVFTVDPTSGAASCAFSYTGPGSEPRFGQALAIGDFNADQVPDLLVGSPPHAFWIAGPLSAASPVLPVALAPGSPELGAAVAAVDVDGQPGDEALVGDPDANVGSTMLAGDVQVATGPTLATKLPALHRQSPAGGDSFGVDAGSLPFCKSGCGTPAAVIEDLALVGSGSHAFTFFTVAGAGADPRKP